MSRSLFLLLSVSLLLSTCGAHRGGSSEVRFRSEAVNTRSARPLKRLDHNEIEWSDTGTGEERTLSLLLHTDGSGVKRQSQLFVFDLDVSIGEVLRSGLVQDLVQAGPGELVHCDVRDDSAQTVDGTAPLAALLQKSIRAGGRNGASLACTLGHGASARHRTFSFVQFIPPRLYPNEVRSHNLLRRSLSVGDAAMSEYPLESGELIGESWSGVFGWVEWLFREHFGPLRPFPDYNTSTTQTGRWHLNTGEVLQEDATFGKESDEPVRIALASDWASGTLESDYVQKVMLRSNDTDFDPHWTLHLGDIYYVGASAWVESNCLGKAPDGVKRGVTWPHGSLGSFAVEGNHEMYSRGYGFFDTFLPTLGVHDTAGRAQGQEAGFVALENRYWRVILLDTGYRTYNTIPIHDNANNTQPESVIQWLLDVVRIGDPADTRGLIFMTHHQVDSAFDVVAPATPQQIAEILPKGRQVIWLWGHEHRLAFYEPFDLPNGVVAFGRCVGNGGFPSPQAPIPPRAGAAGLIAYDDRLYRLETGLLPLSVTYNGFVHLTLEGRNATIVYASLTTDPKTGQLSDTARTDLVRERFTVDDQGNVDLDEFDILDSAITVVRRPTEDETTVARMNLFA